MEITRKDLIYLLLGIALATIGALTVGSAEVTARLYLMAGLLAIVLALAIFMKPSLGANVLILATFTNISTNLGDRGYPTIMKPLVALVAVAILARYLYAAHPSEGRARTARIEFSLFLFFAVTLLSFFVASYKSRALEAIIDLAKDIVIIYCILFTLRRPGVWKQSIWLVILVTAFLSLLGMYQVLTGNYQQDFFGLAAVQGQKVFGEETTNRLAGPIDAPNLWGQVVVAVVPLVLYRLFHASRPLVRVFSVLILGLLLFEVLNTYSRGAYLALLLIAALFLIEERSRPWLPVASVTLLAFLLLVSPSAYRERFLTLINVASSPGEGIYQESSIRGRSSEMLTGLTMFAEHPLLGVGVGNYPNNYLRYAQRLGIEVRAEARDPHSLYVQLLAETGILGFGTFLAMAFLLLKGLSDAKRDMMGTPFAERWMPWLSAMRLSIIGYLTTSFFLHGAYIRYFWVLVALAMAAIRVTEELRLKLESALPEDSF